MLLSSFAAFTGNLGCFLMLAGICMLLIGLLNTRLAAFPLRQKNLTRKQVFKIYGSMFAVGFILLLSVVMLSPDEAKKVVADMDKGKPPVENKPMTHKVAAVAKPPEMSDYQKENIKTVAWVMSRELIKQRLQASSTASFPEMYQSDVKSFGDSDIIINSYVDAENAYGAHVRTEYYCELAYKGGDENDAGNWQIVKCFLRK